MPWNKDIQYNSLQMIISSFLEEIYVFIVVLFSALRAAD